MLQNIIIFWPNYRKYCVEIPSLVHEVYSVQVSRYSQLADLEL